MEKPYNTDEQYLRDLIQEGGLQKPSVDFSSKVMASIQDSKEHVAAKPLISVTGWIVLTFIFLVSSALLYFYPIENRSFTNTIAWPWSNFQEVFSGFEMTNELMYACIFVSLFLIQIPFIKRFLERQRT